MSDFKPTRRIVEENIEGAARELVLAHADVVPFKDGETTPSVAQLRRFKAVGSATITNFLKGSPGQVITILGNGATIVEHNANIKRDGAVTATLLAEKIYTFEYRQVSATDGVWFESGGGIATSVAIVSVAVDAISAALAAEISNRISAVDVVSNAVSAVSSGLSNEASIRAAGDSVLSIAVNVISNAVSSLSSQVTSVNTALSVVSARSVGNVSTHGLQSVVNALSNRISGIVAGTNDPATDTKVWMPLHTVSAGVPKLVWSGLDELIPTLIPVGP